MGGSVSDARCMEGKIRKPSRTWNVRRRRKSISLDQIKQKKQKSKGMKVKCGCIFGMGVVDMFFLLVGGWWVGSCECLFSQTCA